MTQLLHLLALAPAAIGACCIVSDRGRARGLEAGVSALMMVAMIDAARAVPVVPVVAWAAALILASMILAAARSARRASTSGPPDASQHTMTVHTALGLVLMATLLVAMGSHAPSAAGHAHGGVSATGLTTVMAIGTLIYVAASVVWAVGARGWRARTQLVAMGASSLLMAGGTLSG